MEAEKELKRPYKIFDYDPTWVEKFHKLKAVLEDVFGGKALMIEHIGSTAIPGMTSKGVIDACVIVDHMESFEKEKQEMMTRGYQCRENYIGPGTLMIHKEKPSTEKEINIHVISKNDKANIDKFITNRDYLRMHPERVRMYNELKAKLNNEFPNDYPSYRIGKKEFLDETEELARRWKLEQNR